MSKDYDPRMHTAEHILNQTMVRMFNRGRSFGAHIEKKKSKCDYHFDRNLSQKELNEIESRVNEIIAKNLLVTEGYLPRTDAERLYKLEKLPEEAGDNIRIIKVGDYDACPCIGLHVHSTKEIGKFKIISSDFGEGVLRVRFKLNE